MFGANSLLLLLFCSLGLSQATSTMRTNRGVSQGASRKRVAPGYRGLTGRKGNRGRQGLVDYDKVNSTIDEKLHSVISSYCEMERTVAEKIENLVTQLNLKIETLWRQNSLQRQGQCDVWYNNSCFWAIFHSSADMTQTNAESICNNLGARVADIYDETHYDRLVPYLRTKIPTDNTHCYRLGLTYDYSANVARRQSGAESFAKWFPGTPYRRSSSYATIAIWVHKDESSSHQGFYNHEPSFTCNAVLCEVKGV